MASNTFDINLVVLKIISLKTQSFIHSVEPIDVSNLRVNLRAQTKEDTTETSLAAQDINPIAFMSDLLSHPGLDLNPGQYSWLGQATYLA